ncbi:GumC family protein [Poseidonocella sedimentorum]|uniref:non-specific protein-tyrosine kinase n=1 Tax=Poseidonocella sedimentorum TaxID=871652 RepID=A0A1I6DVM4_9RHOB|nr:polysaccharide biosynthesis tyrosine autokinase [Poseidonocella sedimentorum]SFR09539.1 capsular exopolysaccharide family [Poseidonocella sedimentorum]
MAKPSILGEDATQEIIDLGALFARLWRGRFVLALAAMVGFGLGGVYAYLLAEPEYEATASVVLETRSEKVVDLDSVIGGLSKDLPALNTEVEVLRSRRLLGQVVDALALTEDAEFNPTLAEPGLKARLKSRVMSLISDAEPVVAPQQDAQREKAITRLQKRTSVANLPLSLVFQIKVASAEADRAVAIADTIAQTYVDQQISVKYEATEQAVAWLTDRVSDLKQSLKISEDRIKAFRARSDVIGPDSIDQLDRQLKALRGRITDQELAIEAARARLTAAREEARSAPPVTQPQPASTASLLRASTLRPVARAEAEVQLAETRLQALVSAAEELEETLARQNTELQEFQQLTREADASKLLYEYFLGRLKETSVQQGLQRPDSRILSNAVLPDGPARPQKARILGLSLVLGLFAGIGLLALSDLRQKGFRDVTALQDATGMTVFGQVPELPGATRSELLSRLASEPSSMAAEAIRNIRTSLLMSRLDDPPKVVMITSSVADEGKTILSLALAQNIAALGQKVLLIECDVKRPSFARVLRSERKEGLLSVVSGRTELQNAVLSDGETGLDILMCESANPASADMFSSRQFQRFIEAARESYDHILLDTPPVLLVPDARVISRVADAILVALRWQSTSRRKLSDGLAALETVNARAAGIVTTRVDPQALDYGAHLYELREPGPSSIVA